MIREIRGTRTQEEMSNKMGFRYNQWHKWETGQKSLTWPDLVKISELDGISLGRAMTKTIGSEVRLEDGAGDFFKKILERFAGFDISLAETKLGLSKATVYRYLKKDDLDVSVILMSIGELSSKLPFFLSFIIKDSKESSFTQLVSMAMNQIETLANNPWLSALESFLNTADYKQLTAHDDEFVAKALGLGKKQVIDGLSLLCDKGFVHKEGAKYIASNQVNDLEVSLPSLTKYSQYWTDFTLNRMQTGASLKDHSLNCKVFSVSDTAHQEIIELTKRSIGELNKILLSDVGREKNSVKLFLMHYFDHC